MDTQRQKFENLLQVRAPEVLSTAVKIAAARNLMTSSEYVRRSLIDRLRADGVDPSNVAA
jgi:hypothetical protein